MIYITGDTHGDMRRIINFCKVNNLTANDVIIILGDAGINFFDESNAYGWIKDMQKRSPLRHFTQRFSVFTEITSEDPGIILNIKNADGMGVLYG